MGEIICGDSLEVLKTFPENYFDSVVTDPPYGWRFMGKAWDVFDILKMGESVVSRQKLKPNGRKVHTAQSAANAAAGQYDNGLKANRAFQKFTEDWAREAFRVLKPGGHMVVFCGPRTYHRMASGVEDAGFEIRDQLQWLFGSGFPKSLDVSKAIDKAAGATITAPSTDDAKKWQGWGTALKPAFEPLVLAVKPLTGAALLNSLARECLSKLSAKIVKPSSQSNQSESAEAASTVQWPVEGSMPTRDVSSDQMDTSQSVWDLTFSSNIELSWLNTLAELSRPENTFTTEMESSLTIDLKTLSCFLSKSTQENMRRSDGPGEKSTASPVLSLLNALELKLGSIQIRSARENAISEDDHSKSHLADSPTNEPIVLARKPLSESTVAKNVMKHGTGALNIDASRISLESTVNLEAIQKTNNLSAKKFFDTDPLLSKEWNKPLFNPQGRWPSNVLLGCECEAEHESGCAVGELDQQSGQSKSPSGLITQGGQKTNGFNVGGGSGDKRKSKMQGHGDSGGASRFFYVAKTSKRERNAGLDRYELVNLSVGPWENADLKAQLLVDTDQSRPKVIDASGTLNKSVYEWNTYLFGSEPTDQSSTACKYIIEMDKSSITDSVTLNWLRRLSISENTPAAHPSTVSGLNHADPVASESQSTVSTGEKTDSATSANPAAYAEQLRISSFAKLKSAHPTVKPIKLMEYLIRLITKPGGLVLDPFAGSGSTGVAARRLGFDFVGIEKEADYATIAEKRIAGVNIA